MGFSSILRLIGIDADDEQLAELSQEAKQKVEEISKRIGELIELSNDVPEIVDILKMAQSRLRELLVVDDSDGTEGLLDDEEDDLEDANEEM